MREIKYFIHKEDDKNLFPIIKGLIGKYKGAAFREEGGTITYYDSAEDIRYVYSLGRGESEEEGQKILMGNDGASWFRRMSGGGEIDDRIRASNKWQTLITKLSEEFYRNNPVLYFDDTTSNLNQDAAFEGKLRSVVDLFFDEKDVTIKDAKEDSTQYVYAASLRLAVGTSIGVPQPILGKVYFTPSYDGKRLELLSREEAAKLEANLEKVEEEDATNVPEHENVSSIVMALTEVLKGKEHLENNVLFNKSNQALLNKITEKQIDEDRQEDVSVEIAKVTVNTIFLIKVKVAKYDIYFNRFTRTSAPVLRAEVLFDKMTLRCLACRSGDELIRSNAIRLSAADELKRAEIFFEDDEIKIKVTDKKGAQRVGDAEEMASWIEEIKKNVFSKHLLRVECSSCAVRDVCIGYVCKEQQLEVKDLLRGEEERTVIRCADCMYPESYVVVDGEPYTTNSVFYDVNDRRLFVKKNKDGERDVCLICGRTFNRKAGQPSDKCNLCDSLSSSDDLLLHKQMLLYRKYAGLLSLGKRLKGGVKRCAEDASAIVFRIGNVYHVFDKIAAVIEGENFLTGKTVVSGDNGEV